MRLPNVKSLPRFKTRIIVEKVRGFRSLNAKEKSLDLNLALISGVNLNSDINKM